MKLNRQHELFRESVRMVLDRECVELVDDWERDGVMPVHQLCKTLAAEGLLGLTMPVEDGGLGLDLGYSYVWAQELGRVPAGAPAMALSVQTDIVAPLLARAGTPEVRRDVLRPAIRGELVAALAATEPAGGSDLGALTTTAVRTERGFTVNGTKAFITNGSVADFAVVLCRTGAAAGIGDLALLVVPTNLAGVRQVRHTGKLGHRSCDHGTLTFTDVEVPAAYLLGEVGEGYELQTRTFTRERCFLAVVALGQAERVLRATVHHARRRRVLGRALTDHQAIGFRLAELDAELDLVRGYAGEAYQLLADGAQCLREASIAKLRATRLLREVADVGLQVRGAAGYLGVDDVERTYRDARAGSFAGGADEALLHLIAGHLTSTEQE
ncbi:Caffeyl-CoA reductase-Etf complex subunit CarC [Actinosynnema sp. ALI-1.44]